MQHAAITRMDTPCTNLATRAQNWLPMTTNLATYSAQIRPPEHKSGYQNAQKKPPKFNLSVDY